jgi:putative spermidine/putrescine transport system permease protein
MKRYVSVPWSILVLAVLAGPIFLLIPLSLNPTSLGPWPQSATLKWYEKVLTDSSWQDAFTTSLLTAALAAVIAGAFALIASFAIVRGGWRWKSSAITLVLLPMILPVVATGESMYFLFADLNLEGTVIGIALGQAVLALPTAVIVMTASLGEFDTRLELAAMSCGASRLTAIRRVTAPMIWPGIAAGLAFAFLTSFDELIVALFLSSPTVTTLPVKIWSSLQFELDPTVAAASVMILLMVFLIWLIGQLVQVGPRRRTRRRTTTDH